MWVYFLIGFAVGGFLGVLVMCLVIAGAGSAPTMPRSSSVKSCRTENLFSQKEKDD